MAISIILFVVIFGIVVVSHELGHFLLAKAGGITVVEFSVGMGPTLFSFHKGGTKYSLKLFPIGGACMFEGEDGLNTQEGENNPGAFPNANVWKRISTVFAGPFFNFILAFIISLAMVNLIYVRDTVATEVLEGTAAEAAGLQDGDRIISLNGERVYLYEEILLFNALYRGGEVEMVYERDGERYTTYLTPTYNEAEDRYLMGFVGMDEVKMDGAKALRYAWYEMRYNVKNTYKSLGMLVTGQVSRKDVAGPVGIANVVGETYEQAKEQAEANNGGWKEVFMNVLVNMMNITIMLSVNLGILNLLPLPALDGGRLVFLFLEVVRGKPLPAEKEGMVHFIGLMFFMVLMVFIFFNDLVNIFGI